MTASDAPAPRLAQPRTLHLSGLLKRPCWRPGGGESLGLLVRRDRPGLRGATVVTGLVATVGGRDGFGSIQQVTSLDGDPLRLASAPA